MPFMLSHGNQLAGLQEELLFHNAPDSQHGKQSDRAHDAGAPAAFAEQPGRGGGAG